MKPTHTNTNNDEADGERRHVLRAALGTLGIAALAGCTTGPQRELAELDDLASTQLALSGSNFQWVSSIGLTPAASGTSNNLRNLTAPSAGAICVAAGFWAPGDRGGGVFAWTNDVTSADDKGTVIVPKFSGSRTGCWRRVYDGAMNVHWFGAQGSAGSSNDAQYIQWAFDAAAAVGAEVQFNAGIVYLVQKMGTLTGALGYSYCLLLRNGQRVNLRGATIRLAGRQDGACVMVNENLNNPAAPDRIRLFGGTIDGSGPAQVVAGAWTLNFYNLVDSSITDLTIINAYWAGLFVVNAVRLEVLSVSVLNARGNGMCFQVCRSFRGDHLFASGVAAEPNGDAQGNPFIFTFLDDTSSAGASIGTVVVENCAAPIKFQSAAAAGGLISVDSIRVIGGSLSNNAGHSGVKLQGTPTVPLSNVRIGSVICTNLPTIALYFYYANDMHIGSYQGYKNGSGSNPDYKELSDILLIDSSNVRIDAVSVRACKGPPLNTQAQVKRAGYWSIGSLQVRDPQGYPISLLAGRGHIGILDFEDGATATHDVLRVEPPQPDDMSTSIVVGQLRTNRAINGKELQDWWSDSTGAMRIESATFGGQNATCGEQVLSGTSTSVAAASCAIISCLGACQPVRPLVEVVPLNAAAAALGPLLVSVAVAPQTGFTITHASAPPGAKVRWRVVGYTSVQFT